jgi:FKBP-type peptidyl-prolyl cis-trans isomerase FkpA
MTSVARLQAVLAAVLLLGISACDNGSSTLVSPDQSSVQYSQVDLTVGSGAEAIAGTTATVQYSVWLYSENGIDHKGTQLGAETFPFVVGANTVIKGFDMAVTGMKVGGTRRAIVPPSLAYGATGRDTIPPNAALVFEIALTNVQ